MRNQTKGKTIMRLLSYTQGRPSRGYTTTDFRTVPDDRLLDAISREWRAMSVSDAFRAADRLGMGLEELAAAARSRRRGMAVRATEDRYLRARYVRRYSGRRKTL